jgi:hypothetical protein
MLYIAVSVTAACGGASPTSPVAPVVEDLQTTSITVNAAPDGLFTGPTVEFYRDQPLWQAAWLRMTPKTTPPLAVPNADFTNEMFVVVSLGPLPPGDLLSITGAHLVNGSITVDVNYRVPAPNGACYFVDSGSVNVYTVARLPLRSGDGLLHVTNVVRTC